MTGAEEYPDLDELEDVLLEAFDTTISEIELEGGLGIQEDVILDSVVILDEWGHGVAERGEDQLVVGLFLDVDNKGDYGIIEDLDESDVFSELSEEVAESYDGNVEPTDQMLDWFSGVRTGVFPANIYNDLTSVFMNQMQPNRLFDLSKRSILTPGPRGPELEPIEGVEQEDVEGGGGDDILDYPNLDEIREVLNQSFEEARDVELAQASSAQEDVIENLFVEKYVVVGDWGSGSAVRGETPLQIMSSMNVEGATPAQVTFFDRASSNVADRMEQVMEPTQRMSEWFTGISVSSEPSNFFEEGTEIRLRNVEPPRAIDISDNNILRLVDGELQTEPLAPEEGIDTEEEVLEEPEEPSRIEILRERFPDIPAELLIYAEEKGGQTVAEIPAGKDTVEVTPREPLILEQEMFNPGSTNLDVLPAIGESIASQRFGDEDPPATFPRTGKYIRNYLLHQGPAYVLEMYNNLIIYSGYISAMYDGQFKPGRYSSFRKMIHNLYSYSQHPDTAKLVRRLSGSEARSRGLDTTAKLPTGEEATWLEERNYYEIVEENKDHSAWRNVTDALEEVQARQ